MPSVLMNGTDNTCDGSVDRRLAAQTAVLKERNRNLLQAASSARTTIVSGSNTDKHAATQQSGE